ncbi:hypothetical protein METSCH_D06460 [Metschnikowia aff. pulcherrima]|uniref:Uncharacterized protein n=1 Tax=Metschnikowia aff. pulcherrima TaxID=2163413 RepID=A0A4P6XR81_9ASCO|nr:hypothetical protein METSCH_D06460 [Metschnikowia aff. pulcherrima]
MLSVIKTMVLVFLIQKVLAGICSSGSVVPFTGYKVTRRHKIRLRPLTSDSYLVLTKCHRGIPVFSRNVHTSSTLDEFSVPFRDMHTEFDFLDRRKRKRPYLPSLRKPLNITRETPKAPKKQLISSIKAKGDRFMEWYLRGKNDTTPAGIFKGQISKRDAIVKKRAPRSHPPPAPCLKMARRKRYARLDVVIFIPSTFVGALFNCTAETPINTDEGLFEAALVRPGRGKHDTIKGSNKANANGVSSKRRKKEEEKMAKMLQKKVLQKEQVLQKAKVLQKQDDASPLFKSATQTHFSGAPLSPLVADDYSSHWLSVQFNPPALIYHVPYLRSPSSWDPRFRSSPDATWPKWDEHIDINEAYSYSDSEMSRINGALAASTKYMQRLFAAKRTRFSELLAFKGTLLQRFDPRLQLPLFFYSLGKPVSLRHVQHLQRLWDTLLKANMTTLPP